EADPPAVERGVQLGELGQDRGLVDLGGGIVVVLATVGPLGAPLLLGALARLLVAVPLKLRERGTASRHAGSHHPDVLCLVALAPGTDRERALLAGLEEPVARSLDVGVVDEDVVLSVAGDEPVALLRVEELDRANCHGGVTYLLCRPRELRAQPCTHEATP